MPTNKEKAELTYKAIKKRKAKKARMLEIAANEFVINSVYRCMKLRHDIR